MFGHFKNRALYAPSITGIVGGSPCKYLPGNPKLRFQAADALESKSLLLTPRFLDEYLQEPLQLRV